MTPSKVVSWILQVSAAIVLAQTLYFKFSGAPESVWIFTQLNAEPVGRYATGILELAACVLLVIPRTAIAGAGLGALLMTGAAGAHVFRLGLAVMGDGGLLLGLALFVFCACILVLLLRREELKLFIESRRNK